MLELGLGSCAQNYGWKLALVNLHVGLQKWAELPRWGKVQTHDFAPVDAGGDGGRKQLHLCLEEALSEKWAELPRWGKVETSFGFPLVAVVLVGRKQLV